MSNLTRLIRTTAMAAHAHDVAQTATRAARDAETAAHDALIEADTELHRAIRDEIRARMPGAGDTNTDAIAGSAPR